MSPPTPFDPPESDSVDELVATLVHERCREVVRYFMAREDDVASLDDLVEGATTGDGSADRERLAVAYHHVALPKLEAAGVVEYDARSHTVRYWGDPLVERLLSAAGESETVARR